MGGALELVYFKADPTYLKRLLPLGSRRLISGKLESYDGLLQMPHPDHVMAVDGAGGAALPLHEPVYPLTAGLTNTTLRKAVANAPRAGPAGMDRRRLSCPECGPGFGEAIARLHAPATEADLLPSTPARSRLAYDELLANQLALAVIRARLKRRAGRRLAATGKLRKAIIAALPFTRRAKTRAPRSTPILASPSRMLLLQGDVGSGKTVVALLAMAAAVEAGARGGIDGADRVARAPASSDHQRFRRGRFLAHCVAHGPRARTRAHRDPRCAQGGRHRYPDRHARAVPGADRVQRPRPGRHRRAASLRRASWLALQAKGAQARARSSWS